MQDSKKMTGYLLLIIPPLLWSGNFIVGRYVHNLISPISFCFWRWLTAVVALVPLIRKTLKCEKVAVCKHWKYLTLLGFLSVTVFTTLVYIALKWTTALNAGLITASIPIVIILISWIGYRTPISRTQVIGITISLIGVITIITQGRPLTLLSLQLNHGDLLIFLATFAWGLYSVLLKHKPDGISPTTLLFTTSLSGLILLLPWYLISFSYSPTMSVNLTSISCIAYVALFSSLLAFFLWNRGVAQVGANHAGHFIHLLPVFTAVMAVIFLGEKLHPYHFIGITLVLSGIFFAVNKSTKTLKKNDLATE